MDRIEALRKIVKERQAQEIDGTLVDLFSASAVVGVYDRLSEKNQAKFREHDVRTMIAIAFEIKDRLEAKRGS